MKAAQTYSVYEGINELLGLVQVGTKHAPDFQLAVAEAPVASSPHTVEPPSVGANPDAIPLPPPPDQDDVELMGITCCCDKRRLAFSEAVADSEGSASESSVVAAKAGIVDSRKDKSVGQAHQTRQTASAKKEAEKAATAQAKAEKEAEKAAAQTRRRTRLQRLVQRRSRSHSRGLQNNTS